jgi:hypothetical protein
MEKMDMHSKHEYLKVLKEGYLKAESKKEKSQILDEYCRNNAQSSKYVITMPTQPFLTRETGSWPLVYLQ